MRRLTGRIAWGCLPEPAESRCSLGCELIVHKEMRCSLYRIAVPATGLLVHYLLAVSLQSVAWELTFPHVSPKRQIVFLQVLRDSLNSFASFVHTLDYSLRDFYCTLEEPGTNPLRDAHATLDTAVPAAYGMPKDAAVLTFLPVLNHTLAAKERSGVKITPLGLPSRPKSTRSSLRRIASVYRPKRRAVPEL
jgi:hypothetical protein